MQEGRGGRTSHLGRVRNNSLFALRGADGLLSPLLSIVTETATTHAALEIVIDRIPPSTNTNLAHLAPTPFYLAQQRLSTRLSSDDRPVVRQEVFPERTGRTRARRSRDECRTKSRPARDEREPGFDQLLSRFCSSPAGFWCSGVCTDTFYEPKRESSWGEEMSSWLAPPLKASLAPRSACRASTSTYHRASCMLTARRREPQLVPSALARSLRGESKFLGSFLDPG